MHIEYKNKADVLDLIIEVDNFDSFEKRTIETAYGRDETDYVFINKILIGAIVEAGDYYSALNINYEGKTPISLIPAINNIFNIFGIDLPKVDDFLSALSNSINSEKSNWIMICERDCDQEPVPRIKYGTEKANESISQLFDFIRGAHIECPTFLIEHKR